MSSSDRRPYLTATALTQSFLDACHDNLECRLEMICEIESPDGTIYASDRNKYVGGTFYEALLVFPTIQRTVGEWLSNELQFATLTLELSNVDERFGKYLPGGADYGSWVGKQVVVKLGLAEQASTYTTVFKGSITPVGGFRRTIKSVVIVARDNFDRINAKFPTAAITFGAYPRCEQKNLGKLLPVIYGDWTTELDPYPSAVPAYVVNGNDPQVSFKEKPVTIVGTTHTSTAHGFDEGDAIEFATGGTLPSPLVAATVYYARNPTGDTFNISSTPLGALINATGGSGSHTVKAATGSARADIELVVSSNVNFLFDIDTVYVKRSEIYNLVPASEIMTVNGDKNFFTVRQNGVWMNDGAGALIAYEWADSDEFFCQVIGKDLSSYRDNPVEQVRDLLKTYGGLVDGDFDSNWVTYRDKASPSQSAVVSIKSRIWVAEQNPVLTYGLSIFEQIRLEAFIDRNLKLKINALHFEDWQASPSYTVKNWDIERNSMRTQIDDRNNFNRAQGAFNFLPIVNENVRATPILKNTASITQTGLTISKKIVFPNLYVESQVVAQLREILRISSGIIEVFDLNLTWRALLLDIGSFVKMNINVASINLENVPAMVREIGYDPDGLKIVSKLWSFQMLPFGSWNPGYNGITGGQAATIDEET
jgi:hypothetical protein